MTSRRTSLAIAAAALLSAVAGVAHAADKGKPIDFTVKSEPATVAAPNLGQMVTWDASTRKWGVTVNMQQQNLRPSTLNDVQAGAYFRVTPSLRVGGSVALGEQDAAAQRRFAPTPARAADQPKVRLETAFKF